MTWTSSQILDVWVQNPLTCTSLLTEASLSGPRQKKSVSWQFEPNERANNEIAIITIEKQEKKISHCAEDLFTYVHLSLNYRNAPTGACQPAGGLEDKL